MTARRSSSAEREHRISAAGRDPSAIDKRPGSVLTLVQWLRSHGVDAYVDKFERCYESRDLAEHIRARALRASAQSPCCAASSFSRCCVRAKHAVAPLCS